MSVLDTITMLVLVFVVRMCDCSVHVGLVEMSHERRIVVLYGSQTGTAQEVAERIERDAVRRHLLVTIKPLDEYDIVCVARNYQFVMFMLFLKLSLS